MKIKKIMACLTVCVATIMMNAADVHAASAAISRGDVNLISGNMKFETCLPEPVTEVRTEDGIAQFEYGVGNSLRKKKNGDEIVSYSEVSGRIMSAKSDNYEYTLRYGRVDDVDRYLGIDFDGRFFEFEYDDGNVNSIKYNGVTVCRYDYSDSPVPKVIPTSEYYAFVGNTNPIRYQGWFWNDDIEVYYLGSGIFYDPQKGEFLQNDFTIEKGLWSLSKGEYHVNEFINSDIENMYIQLMNDSTYGAQCSSGPNWYASRPVIETIARCIYAENTYDDRLDDRIAIAAVILNRMSSQNKTGYQVVTAEHKFSSINPGNGQSVGSNTYSAKGKNDAVWQQATLLACIVYYGKTRDNISSFYSIPAGITSQENFRAFSSVTLTYSEGARIGGTLKKDVAIAGYGVIGSTNDVNTVNRYTKKKYNIFFND